MRAFSLAFAAFAAHGFLVAAATIHVDVSHEGDIELDLDTTAPSASRSGSARQVNHRGRAPTLPRSRVATDGPKLGEFDVDLYYEIHRGFPSVSRVIT